MANLSLMGHYTRGFGHEKGEAFGCHRGQSPAYSELVEVTPHIAS